MTDGHNHTYSIIHSIHHGHGKDKWTTSFSVKTSGVVEHGLGLELSACH